MKYDILVKVAHVNGLEAVGFLNPITMIENKEEAVLVYNQIQEAISNNRLSFFMLYPRTYGVLRSVPNALSINTEIAISSTVYNNSFVTFQLIELES